ncbi:MAG: hypothetical protein HY701_07765 [Gemmatimonadetes bacterium]|nr:hypothetical protein [Gemmatimonadota bacterium]
MSVTVSASAARQVGRDGSIAQVGVVEGVVRLRSGELPSPTQVRNTTDPDVCGPEQTLEDLIVSPTNRGLRDVVVALAGVPREGEARRGPQRLVLDNRGCRFDPHVAAAMLGDTIVARNSDATLHTTHFYGALRGNLSMPQQGMQVLRVAQRTGMISILCDVHGWMKAYIAVYDHPFYEVTDRDGTFRIESVPTGDYIMEAWHEVLGTQQVRVRVESGRTTRVELEYAHPGTRTTARSGMP